MYILKLRKLHNYGRIGCIGDVGSTVITYLYLCLTYQYYSSCSVYIYISLTCTSSQIVRKAGIVTVTEVITLKIGIAELITEEKVITEVITVERVEVGNITEVGEGVDHPHEIGKSKGPEVHISLVIIGHTYVCMYYLQCDIFCIPGTCTCNITTIFRYQKVKK